MNINFRFLLEDRVIDAITSRFDLLFLVLVSVLAILIRMTDLSFQSADYQIFIKPWLAELRAEGRIFGIVSSAANYTPPAMLPYALISYFPPEWELVLVKLVSTVSDFILAYFSAKIVEHITSDRFKKYLAYTLILFGPTIWLESGIWGQCDVFYTTFAVIAIYKMLKEKQYQSMFFFGLALAFKLQAIFLLPFLLMMFPLRYFNLLHYLFIPVGLYSLNILLSFIGIPINKWAEIYFYQTGQYDYPRVNAPTIFALVNIHVYFGIIVSMSIMSMLFLCMFKLKRNLPVETVFVLLLTTLVTVVYFLPYMHERYFFMADVVVLLCVALHPRKWYMGVFILVPFLITYSKYLFQFNVATLETDALIMTVGLVLTWKWLLELLYQHQTGTTLSRSQSVNS